MLGFQTLTKLINLTILILLFHFFQTTGQTYGWNTLRISLNKAGLQAGHESLQSAKALPMLNYFSHNSNWDSFYCSGLSICWWHKSNDVKKKKKKSSIKQFSFTQLKFLNEVASQKNIIYKAAKIIFIKFWSWGS